MDTNELVGLRTVHEWSGQRDAENAVMQAVVE